MSKLIATWLVILSMVTVGAIGLTYSRANIPYANETRVSIREDSARHGGPVYFRSHRSRRPLGGGFGHGK